MSPSLPNRTVASRNDLTPAAPWWRFGMVWLLLSGPAIVIVAGFATLAICLQHPDAELHEAPLPGAVAKRGNPVTRAATWQSGDAATISGH
jgi:hypothetical protein